MRGGKSRWDRFDVALVFLGLAEGTELDEVREFLVRFARGFFSSVWAGCVLMHSEESETAGD